MQNPFPGASQEPWLWYVAHPQASNPFAGLRNRRPAVSSGGYPATPKVLTGHMGGFDPRSLVSLPYSKKAASSTTAGYEELIRGPPRCFS